MTGRIYLSSPDVTHLEEAAVARAMASGWIAPLGPELDAFEHELAEYCGRRHAVALSSGTAALHLALRGVDHARPPEPEGQLLAGRPVIGHRGDRSSHQGARMAGRGSDGR